MMNELDAKTKQQIKVYSRWVANKLKNVETCTVNDVTTDLADGTALIELAEILTKKKADPAFKKPAKFTAQKVQKCDYAITMFKDNGISLGNSISGKDITDKNIRQTLYLIWMLILNYSIDPAVREDSNFQFSKDNASNDSKNVVSRNKIQLLTWATEKIKNYPNIEDKFQPYDLSMCALIHEYYPSEINYNNLNKEEHDTNLQIANDAMEKLQIPVFITPEDFQEYNYKVDEDCLMTQLSALKGCLDKKLPKRKSLIGRQNNNKFTRPKISEILNESTQAEPTQSKKKRNIPTGKPQKKVKINTESYSFFPEVKNKSKSEQEDLKNSKNISKSTSNLPIKTNTNKNNNKNVNTETKDLKVSNKNNKDESTETKPSITNNRNMKFDSNNIYTQSGTRDNQKMQIESTKFDIQPISKNKEKKDFDIFSSNGKQVETRDFGVQQDYNHTHRKHISTSSSGLNQKTTKDFGIQPDSENLEKNNQVQSRDVNIDLDLSIDSIENSNESPRKNKNHKNSGSKKNLEIGGEAETNIITEDNEINDNRIHKEKHNNEDDDNIENIKQIQSQNADIVKPRNRKRQSGLKNGKSKHSKLDNKRRNTYVGSSSFKNLINDDDNDKIEEEEEEKDDQKDNDYNNSRTETGQPLSNKKQIQTKEFEFDIELDSDEKSNSKDSSKRRKSSKEDDIENKDEDEEKIHKRRRRSSEASDSDRKNIKLSNKRNKSKNHLNNQNNDDEEEGENEESPNNKKQISSSTSNPQNKNNKVQTREAYLQSDQINSESEEDDNDKNRRRIKSRNTENNIYKRQTDIQTTENDRIRRRINLDTQSESEEVNDDDNENTQSRKIKSRNADDNFKNRQKYQTKEVDNVLETRDIGVQSPKNLHRSKKQFGSLDSLNESSNSSAPKTLRIKVNGNIDRSIVITVRNYSHHSKRNESARSSHRHTHSNLNSPIEKISDKNSPSDSPSKYRSNSTHRSHSSSRPTTQSMPNTPTYNGKECSIVPVFNNEDGNRTPTRKFRVHIRDQDFTVKKKFVDSASGIKITLNDNNQDNNSQKEEQNVDF